MHNLISPSPMAVMDDPPTPFTERTAIGRSVMKCDFSGEIWTVAPGSM